MISRRHFVQRTAFAAAALYGRPTKLLAETRPIFGVREQKAASFDPAAIRELASRIRGRVITPEAPDYELLRLVENRAFDAHPALIVRCASPCDVARALDFGERHSLRFSLLIWRYSLRQKT